MSQFDETTENKAEEYAISKLPLNFYWKEAYKTAFKETRNSAKESLAILARALDFHEGSCVTAEGQRSSAAYAIAAVKARGDWPLEEKPRDKA